MGFAEHIKNEGAEIMKAPAVFFSALVGLLVISSGIIWFLMDWRWSGVVDALEGHIATQQERLAAKDDQLAAKDALIVSLKSDADLVPSLVERIKVLEDRVFTSAIKDSAPSMGNLVINDKWGKLFAENSMFTDALKSKGWTVVDAGIAGAKYLPFLSEGPVFEPDSTASYLSLIMAMKTAGVPFSETTANTGDKIVVLDAAQWWDAARPEPSAP